MGNWTPLGAGRKSRVVMAGSKLLLQAPRAQSQNEDEMLLNQMTPLGKKINPDRAALPKAKSPSCGSWQDNWPLLRSLWERNVGWGVLPWWSTGLACSRPWAWSPELWRSALFEFLLSVYCSHAIKPCFTPAQWEPLSYFVEWRRLQFHISLTKANSSCN